MRIIIVSLSAPSVQGQNGGAQVYILNLSIGLVRKGHHVSIVAGNEKKQTILLPSHEIINGVSIIRLGSRAFPLLAILNYLFRNWKDTDIILENIMTYPFYLPLFFPFSNKLKALKHHFLGKRSSAVLPKIKHILNSLNENVLIPSIYKAENLIVPSKRTVAFLISKSKKFKKITIIPPGITHLESGEVRSVLPMVLYVGTLNTNRKKVDDLISAFQLVAQNIPDAKLVIAGDGPDRPKLEEMAINLPIEFKGYVSEEEKHALYTRSWVFASPSLVEGFGITWIEANAHGVPVVTYDLGLETISNDSAIQVPIGNIELLASAIEDLISDEFLRAKLSEGAKVNAAKYSWETTTEKFLNWVN
jgi:glycosyltransferase involved in cell wall biosynthesis